MSTNTPQPDWADEAASNFFDKYIWSIMTLTMKRNAANLLRQAAANHYLPELRMAEEERKKLIDALKMAADAIEQVSGAIDDRFQDDLNEEVLGPVMARIQALTHPNQ